MNNEPRKAKLSTIADSIMAANSDEVGYLLKRLELSKTQVIDAYVAWDLDVNLYGNEIYDSLPLRFAMHLHNLVSSSWHAQRQTMLNERLRASKFKTVTDIGFGVPQSYVKDIILHDDKYNLSLLDAFESALTFAEALLDYWNPKWRARIQLQKYDMNSSQSVQSSDAYLLMDSIEHAREPAGYLRNIVDHAPKSSRFICTLPIATGPPEPSHYIAWNNQEEAQRWLEDCGLDIPFAQEIYMNPKVDLFAKSLNKGFFELFVDCKKAPSR